MCQPIKQEDWDKTIQHVYTQTKQLSNGPQELNKAKFRCECWKWVLLKYGYRCLYCDALFCKSCSEIHFGQTIEEYRKKHPIETGEPARKEG